MCIETLKVVLVNERDKARFFVRGEIAASVFKSMVASSIFLLDLFHLPFGGSR